ncbi:pilus assembly protein TadG-related protein [Roseovarius aestuariivivens]|uniref:pilus assembly protein TadG-related protein n=1 Tax=Roseovarius aestuariivivens TaxID=1888910 RepID=UPI00107FDA32|nr:pilus assembly protein TadG-related protein [Roseovarius aestuariivivens]
MRLNRIISRFYADETGTIAILWGTSLVAFLGFLAITLDVGRLSATQAEMQAFADHVALAAAGELDGKNDAITRSANAAANLINDSQTFANGSGALSGAADYTLTFHSALPPSDLTPLGANATTDPNEAKFVQVVLTPKSVSMVLASALNKLLGGNGFSNTDVSAEAVAGFTQAACDVSPLMFCLPTNWETTLDVGDQILLRSGGNGTAWGPGNFGFIDLAAFEDTSGVCADEGGNKLACLIAAQKQITQCVLTNGIDTEPGQKVGITNAAFNVRFDIYRSVLNGEKDNPDFAPAPNVIKGIQKNGGGACIQGNEEPTGDTMALGRDLCLNAGSCGGNNRFGDGTWDRAGYLNMNYDLVDGTADGIGSDAALPPLSAANTQYAGTRFGMYLREIAYGDTTASKAILHPSLSETGRPICSGATPGGPERRVITAAGVDCGKTVISGATTGVPVTKFVSIFLTEPVGDDGGSPPSFDIHGEVVGFPDAIGAGGGSSGFGGIFRDVVQLYR